MARSSPTSVLKDLLGELREWRSSPCSRQRLLNRPLDKEHPDPTPVEIPIGYERPPSLAELVQRYVRDEVSQVAKEGGYGTFEEEDDFDIDDPDDLGFSPYELTELQMVEEVVMDDASPPGASDVPEGSESLSEASEASPNPGTEDKPNDQ